MTRPHEPDPAVVPPSLRVFISYAHEDDGHKISLEKALRLLQREGLIETWSDRKLLGGDEWKNEIDARLERADLILLLVSPDFINSNYCWDVEVRCAMERHEAGSARVVPIVVRPTDWATAPFAKLQGLPGEARPVTRWADEDEAWLDVAMGLRRIVQQRQTFAVAARAAAAAAEPAIPIGYLTRLYEENAYIEIRGMGAQVAEQMPLDRVYTRLRIVRRGGPDHERRDPDSRNLGRELQESAQIGQHGEPREVELRDVLPDSPHVVLIGDPGSGKTTFVRFVAQTLARDWLEDQEALCRERLGLTGPPPFPVWIRLTEFARFLQQPCNVDYPDDAPEHLLRFLDYTQTGDPCGLSDGRLSQRVRSGRCYLLLDGLDEVPAGAHGREDQRDRVARIVHRTVVMGKTVGNRHLVTCRTRAYEDQTGLAAHVTTLELAPFSPDQIGEFVDRWSRALRRVDPHDAMSEAARQAAHYASELHAAIDAHPGVGPMARNPLMLTVLAVVHWNRKRLPEQRADLYEAAVTYLLESRDNLSPYPVPLRREALQALAARMFEDAEGVQRSLGRTEAADAVRSVLGGERPQALEFLDEESLFSGLLMMRTAGEYEFWHLTFQEYLVAMDLAMDRDYWRRIADRLESDRWREVLLLFAGCLRRSGGIRAARDLVKQILATGGDRVSRARAVALVGAVLHDIAPYGGDHAEGTSYAVDLRSTLGIFEAGGELVEESVRVEVGEALGQAGDPRFADPLANRIGLPGGTFLMGAQDQDPDRPGYDPDASPFDAQPELVTVAPFTIGRYPVTVEEFSRFLAAGEHGYLDPESWDPVGWAWRQRYNVAEPDKWSAQVVHSNRPVVGVSWFEADAYARWIKGSLPTEQEWEWAARGATGRKYPWGDDGPTPDHAAYGARRGAPSPVGVYPLGATPEKICDLAGNVWEWCADLADVLLRATMQRHLREGADWVETSRVFRGGSFNSHPDGLRGALRDACPPNYRNVFIGFRVVWRASTGQ